MKYPQFYEVNDTFVKIDYDAKTDEVFGITANGNPYPIGKCLAEGSTVTQEDFNQANKRSFTSDEMAKEFVDNLNRNVLEEQNRLENQQKP